MKKGFRKKDKKIVIQFVHALTSGGAETMVAEYAVRLKQRGYDVRIVVQRSMPEMPNQKKIEQAKIPLISIFPSTSNIFIKIIQRLFREWYSTYFMRQYIKQVQPDIIHIHLMLARFILGARKYLEGVKIIYTCHSDPRKIFLSNTREVKKDTRALNTLIKKYDARLIALHTEMKREIDDIFGINNVIVLHNPVDVSCFKNVNINKKDYRKKLEIPENSYVIGHIGRFTQVKNHKKLVRIFSRLIEQKKEAFLLMVGDGNLKEKIKEELNSLGLQNRYKILSNRSDIPELLAIMDVFCFPSIYEGLPLTVLEAQAAGKKCVISENITDEVMCTNNICALSPDKNEVEWVEAILNPIPGSPHQYSIQEFDIANIMDSLEEIYNEKVRKEFN